jgi:hypothetical protein
MSNNKGNFKLFAATKEKPPDAKLKVRDGLILSLKNSSKLRKAAEKNNYITLC